jgi:protein involved in polysaccharide export with SLBB domain
MTARAPSPRPLATVAAALLSLSIHAALAPTAGAQQRPSPAQAQALLQTRPDLVAQLTAQLKASGLSNDQIKARLRAEGYPDNLLDAYLPGGKGADSTAVPGDDVFGAMRALGLADTTSLDSLRGVARGRRREKTAIDSAFLDTLTRAAQNDSVRAALRRLLRSNEAMRSASDSGFTIFGLNLFHNETSQFDPTLAGPVDASYRFGPGDRLVLILTGDVEASYPLEVTRQGFVVVPNVGEIQVGNLTAAQLDDVLYSRLGRVYSGVRRSPDARTHFSVNVSRVGTNQVIVTGDVVQPNAYAVSRAGTAMDAVYKAQGPTENGSLRDIEIRRGAQTVGVLDLYDYLLRGDASRDVRLENGDVIFVPPHGARARVVGAVLRSATYEMKPSETIADLIAMAGGFTATADPSRVTIERIVPPAQRTSLATARRVIDVPRDIFGRNAVTEATVEDGDIVRVGEVPKHLASRVVVDGNVWSPGEIGFVPGMTLTEALRRAGGLRPDSYLGQVQISRLRSDSTYAMVQAQLRDTTGATNGDVPLADGDQIQIFSLPEFRPNRYITVSGAVAKGGRIPYRDGMTLRDAVLLAGGLREGALLTEAEIAHMPENRAGGVTATTTRVPLDSSYLFDRRADGTYGGPPGIAAPTRNAPDVRLKPYDNVLVFRQPDWAFTRTVSIQGEVKYPGRYTVRTKGERLLDLINRAGGLTTEAYANGIEFYRSRDSVGRIGLDLPRVMRDPSFVDNMLLADGDSIYVPVYSSVVSVAGAVNAPVAVSYVHGANLDYYIRAAGGGNAKSDLARAYVTQPNGKLESRNTHLHFFNSTPKPAPGSTVYVPLADTSEHRDYTGLFTAVASILGSAVALAAILRR